MIPSPITRHYVTPEPNYNPTVRDRFLKDIENVPSSLVPFRCIKFLMENGLFTRVVQTTVSLRKCAKVSDAEIQTSCVLNTRTIAELFLGVEKADQVDTFLNYYTNVEVAADDIKLNYGIDNLLTGSVMETYKWLELKTKFPVAITDQKTYEFIQEPFDNFTKYIEDRCLKKSDFPEMTDEDFQKKKRIYRIDSLRNCTFDFNAPLIFRLMQNIENNIPVVNPGRSFLYCLAIKLEGYESEFHHYYAIEQFWDRGVRYRPYQSWITGMSLSDYMQKTQERTYVLQGIQNHLVMLWCYLNPANRPANIDLLRLKLFAYDSEIKMTITKFDEIKMALTGMNFRYMFYPFDPSSVKNNVMQFLQRPEMQ